MTPDDPRALAARALTLPAAPINWTNKIAMGADLMGTRALAATLARAWLADHAEDDGRPDAAWLLGRGAEPYQPSRDVPPASFTFRSPPGSPHVTVTVVLYRGPNFPPAMMTVDGTIWRKDDPTRADVLRLLLALGLHHPPASPPAFDGATPFNYAYRPVRESFPNAGGEP